MNTPPADRAPHSGWYRIRIQGRLASRWATHVEPMTLTREHGGCTLIQGPVVDQAALHGLLQQVRDTGLPLISVTQAGPGRAQRPHRPFSSKHALPASPDEPPTKDRLACRGPLRDHLHHRHRRQVLVLPATARRRRLQHRQRRGLTRLVDGPRICLSGAAVILGVIEPGSTWQNVACIPSSSGSSASAST